jgi:hypothetical protein
MQDLQIWKFSNTATDTPTMKIDNPKDFLKSKYINGYIFGIDNLQKNGIYRLSGWAYNFRPYLKKYVVKQYDQWQEYYAPNKTSLRATLYGRIDKIQEIN